MMMVMVLVLMMTMKTITVLWQTKTSSVLSVSSGIFSFSSCDQTFLNCAFIFIFFRNHHCIICFLSCHYYFQQNLPDSWWLTRCSGEVRSSWEVSLTFCFVFASPSFKISFRGWLSKAYLVERIIVNCSSHANHTFHTCQNNLTIVIGQKISFLGAKQESYFLRPI